jgi:diacylglycerol kinase (ATP)
MPTKRERAAKQGVVPRASRTMLRRMRGLVIVNPNAGSSAGIETAEQALIGAGFTLHATKARGDAFQAARSAADEGFDTVVAAGGDGTVTEVVDGLAAAGGRARLGILPLGTGNDLARALAIPLDLDPAIATLVEGNERTIDLVEVRPDGAPPTHAANVAAGGFSGRVDEEMTAEDKERWGTLAYVLGAMKALPDLAGYQTTIAWDDGDAQQIDALAVLVANGRSVAGGRVVAPLACLEDGLLDVIVLRSGSLLDLAGVAARLALGTFLESDAVEMRRARALRIDSTPPMRFNVDGELLPEGPVTFRVLPGALRVIVGRDYRASPEGVVSERP